MNKKLSIITVNYNDKAGLTKTINSVLNQTSQDFDFIIIDGGSSDGSAALIEQYKDKISYSVSERDNGVYHAMNKGIRAATGEFVIFMNGGDCFYNDSVLEEVLPELTADFDIYYGDNYKKTGSSQRLKKYPEKLNFSFFFSSSINHQSTFIRKSLFEAHFYYNESYRIASDWEFFVYTICHQNVPYKYLNKTIATYDFTGISSDPKFIKIFDVERNQTLQKYFPAFADEYKNIDELNSKRFKQIFFIRENKKSWKVLKTFLSILLLFLPKLPKENTSTDK